MPVLRMFFDNTYGENILCPYLMPMEKSNLATKKKFIDRLFTVNGVLCVVLKKSVNVQK